jgi:hypothetical protein
MSGRAPSRTTMLAVLHLMLIAAAAACAPVQKSVLTRSDSEIAVGDAVVVDRSDSAKRSDSSATGLDASSKARSGGSSGSSTTSGPPPQPIPPPIQGPPTETAPKPNGDQGGGMIIQLLQKFLTRDMQFPVEKQRPGENFRNPVNHSNTAVETLAPGPNFTNRNATPVPVPGPKPAVPRVLMPAPKPQLPPVPVPVPRPVVVPKPTAPPKVELLVRPRSAR